MLSTATTAARDLSQGTTVALPNRLVILAALCVLTGCGGRDGVERAAISGSVQLDGAPLEQGMITFLPTDAKGGPSAGGAIEKGEYKIPVEKGAALGKHKVEIRSLKKTGKQIPVEPPAVSATGVIDETVEAIPARYNSETTLTQDVQSGINAFDFDLKSE